MINWIAEEAGTGVQNSQKTELPSVQLTNLDELHAKNLEIAFFIDNFI